MGGYTFYSAILGLSSEWRISDVTVDEQTGITELHIKSQGAKIRCCPTCGADVASAGARRARWLHDNHLNIRFLISAVIPVMTCEHCGKVKFPVPWEQSGTELQELEKA
ncbi:MAG: hypothetical protein A2X80_14185 [Geobacteraceae bacterium GWB2_52_12]|nr:MAG: hypothetical protein A2X80_14185 [Geobacteraceae bacterium GWB2_52_12]